MRKKSLLLLSLLAINIAGVHALENIDKKISKSKLIGGFSAPIFFTHYDQNLIDNICANPNQLKKINISYPPNLKKLAVRITDEINRKCRIVINSQELELQDTDKVKYRHDAVVVVLRFN